MRRINSLVVSLVEAASPASLPMEKESTTGKAHELWGSLKGSPEALGIFLQCSLFFSNSLDLFLFVLQDSNIVGSQLSLMDVIRIEVYSSQGCLNGVLEELPSALVSPAQSWKLQ